MNLAINPLIAIGVVDGRDRRGLRILQRRGEQQASGLGRELECDLVHAVGLCGDQLH